MHRLAIAASVAVVAAMCTNCAQESSSSGNLLPSPSILAPSSVDSANGVTIGAEAKGGGGGKPGGGGTTSGGGSGSLTLRMVTDLNGDGGPNWGDTITWDISTTATTEPNVSVKCSQNGAVVYSAVGGFYASYPWPWTVNMTLSSQSWTGGSASCVAQLYYISGTSTVNLGSTSFTAKS